VTAVLPWERLGSKVGDQHLQRLAVVYVRQSTRQQVLDHQESTRLQYALVERAVGLGWPADRVVVIDEDLGKSAASAAGRSGFQRLVTEITMGHVGLVLGIEMSRLARSGSDWYQLLELCALSGALLADADGVYDPAEYNDRLLLGLKGTMSEAELHLPEAADAGRAAGQGPPRGAGHPAASWVCAPRLGGGGAGPRRAGPDRGAAGVRQVRRAGYAARGAALAGRPRHPAGDPAAVGARHRRVGLAATQPDDAAVHAPQPGVRGDLRLRPPAGRPPPAAAGPPSTGRVVRAEAEWLVLLPGRLPAYISVEQYHANLARLAANTARAETPGVARAGSALLSGLARCGRCGRRMTVRYHLRGQTTQPEYVCARQVTDYGAGQRCQALAGACVDALVTEQVLAALAPAALEVSLHAAQQVQAERAELEGVWQQRLERAAIAADRARRCYRLAEPENRLVTRQLEADWEAALADQQRLREDYDRFCRTRPRALTPAQQQAIAALAGDIPALWAAPTTTDLDRKQLIRALVEQVTITIQGRSERVAVTITWAGGHTTHSQTVRPVARLDQLTSYPQLLRRVRELAEDGHRAHAITRRLHAEGFRPAKGRDRIGVTAISQLLRELGYPPTSNRARPTPPPGQAPGPDEWWLDDLATELGMPPITLHSWLRRGWAHGRKETTPPHRWILHADQHELAELRQRRTRPPGWYTRRRWADPIPPTRNDQGQAASSHLSVHRG